VQLLPWSEKSDRECCKHNLRLSTVLSLSSKDLSQVSGADPLLALITPPPMTRAYPKHVTATAKNTDHALACYLQSTVPMVLVPTRPPPTRVVGAASVAVPKPPKPPTTGAPKPPMEPVAMGAP